MPMVTAAPQPRGTSAFDAERKRGDGTMRRHNGVDLFAPKGHMVTAPGGATVLHAHASYEPGFAGYGRVVVLKLDKDQGEMLIAHLDDVRVKKGDRVAKGHPVGTVGDTVFTRADHTRRFDTSKPHAHVELLKGDSYPTGHDTARKDPTKLAFYAAPVASTEPETEMFATPGDALRRANALSDRWNALQNQALGPAVKPRSDVSTKLQDQIMSDRKRFRRFITRPTFGVWGALVPQGVADTDYDVLGKWYDKYALRARQLRQELAKTGKTLSRGAQPKTLPRNVFTEPLIRDPGSFADDLQKKVAVGLGVVGAAFIALVIVQSLVLRRGGR